MANCSHLITSWLDTALIDDMGCGGVVGEVVIPSLALAGPVGEPWLFASGGGLAPCRAHLPAKGGLFLKGIFLLWLDLGPSDMHVGSSNLLVSCILSWVGASILISCLCTVWATDPGFVVPIQINHIVINYKM